MSIELSQRAGRVWVYPPISILPPDEQDELADAVEGSADWAALDVEYQQLIEGAEEMAEAVDDPTEAVALWGALFDEGPLAGAEIDDTPFDGKWDDDAAVGLEAPDGEKRYDPTSDRSAAAKLAWLKRVRAKPTVKGSASLMPGAKTDAARTKAISVFHAAPVPGAADIAAHEARKLASSRQGGDDRGSSKDRKARRAFLLEHFGDGKTCPCVYCGARLTDDTVEADRVYPGEAGGRYTRNNVVPACRACNASRGDVPFSEVIDAWHL